MVTGLSVRGTLDWILKELRKLNSKISTISNSGGGGGGSQDLQSVLETGSSASFDGNNTTVILGDVTPFDRSVYMNMSSENNVTSSFIFMDKVSLNLEQSIGEVQSKITQESGLLSLSQFSSSANKTFFVFDTPISNTVISVPSKAIPGTYTLATLDDIKIGTVAPTSATATGITGEIRVAAGFIYWCTAPNTWIRAAGATW
jgi:hypothetical protein